MDIVVSVIGAQETAATFIATMDRVVDNVRNYAQGARVPLEATLRATIQHVVYDAYQPTRYKRTGGLIDAVASDYREQGAVITLEFYNDPGKVTLRRDPISAGGSHKQDVPLEIEEGRWPPRMGFSVPRPAYRLFGVAVAPQIHAGVLDAIAKAIR